MARAIKDQITAPTEGQGRGRGFPCLKVNMVATPLWYIQHDYSTFSLPFKEEADFQGRDDSTEGKSAGELRGLVHSSVSPSIATGAGAVHR
jgi:hypothetical protein